MEFQGLLATQGEAGIWYELSIAPPILHLVAVEAINRKFIVGVASFTYEDFLATRVLEQKTR